jgi:hypothetical protein
MNRDRHFPYQELHMALQQTHRYFGRHYHATPFVKLAALLVGLVVVGSIAVALVGHAPPWLSTASGASPASWTSNSAASTAIAATQAWTGVATAAVPEAPAATAEHRNFDYFPDHYVNRATKMEEPIATF